MHSPDEVADRILALMRDVFDQLRTELTEVSEDVLLDVQVSLHNKMKSIPGPSLADREEARRSGNASPLPPPERWVGMSALTMGVALRQARRTQ